MPSQQRYCDGLQSAYWAHASVTFDSPKAVGSATTSSSRPKVSNSVTCGLPLIALSKAEFIDDAIAVASAEVPSDLIFGVTPTSGTSQTTISCAPAACSAATISPMFVAKPEIVD